MSQEERLARLGLAHLIDKPEELKKALEERVARRQQEEAEAEKERQEKAKKKRS